MFDLVRAKINQLRQRIILLTLTQWFSKCGPGVRRISVTLGAIQEAYFEVPIPYPDLEVLRVEIQQCKVLKVPRVVLMLITSIQGATATVSQISAFSPALSLSYTALADAPTTGNLPQAWLLIRHQDCSAAQHKAHIRSGDEPKKASSSCPSSAPHTSAGSWIIATFLKLVTTNSAIMWQ